MKCASVFVFLLSLSLASHSAAMTLYSGEMELVAVSGGGCAEKDKPGTRIPLVLTLEQVGDSNGRQITGYFSGPEIQTGRFSGDDLGRLQLVYPDEAKLNQGNNILELSIGVLGVDGELREKPQSDFEECYFEKAVLKLKQEAAGDKAESVFARQSNLFSAEAHFASGHALLKADKPEEAIADFTKSLNLRSMVDPNDPDRAVPAVSLALAQIMAGREAKAEAVLRDLLGTKTETGDEPLKRRTVASVSLCNEEQFLESDAGRKASRQLMDIVARTFGSLEGVAVPLSACYCEMAKEQREQDDPDLAIEYFKKALKLNPDNPDIVTGVAMSFVDKEAPAEGRKYLDEHKEHFIKRSGKEPYDALLSYLYAAEAQQEASDGDLSRAVDLLREAVKAEPGDRSLMIELTRVLGKKGKTAEARKLLEGGRKDCRDESCRREFADEIARQEMIERMVKRLETRSRVQ